MASRATATQSCSKFPIRIGPSYNPSNSQTPPLKGTQDTKWKTSSPSLAFFLDLVMKGSGRAKLLWAMRMTSRFPRLIPLDLGSRSMANSQAENLAMVTLQFESVAPISISGRFRRMEMIAWVAHAFWITWLAKNRSWSYILRHSRFSPLLVQRKRKMRPQMGCIFSIRGSSLRSQISSTCTPWTPMLLMSSVNTPGSDSIVHHSCIYFIIFNMDAVIPTLLQQERDLAKKRQGKGLDIHFHIFNDFVKKKSAGYPTVTIFLCIAFAHHFLSLIRQYKNLLEIHYETETTIIDQLLSALQYVDVQGLLLTDGTVALIMLACSLALTVGNTLLYVIIWLLGKEYRARKKFIGRTFIFMSVIYIWMLHFPCMVTFFQFIVCEPAIGCKYSPVRLVTVVLSCLGLLCGTFNIIVLTFFYHNNGDNKKDCLNSENTFYLALFQFYRTILAVLVCIKYYLSRYSSSQYAFLWLLMIITFSFHSWFLLHMVLGGGYCAFATSFTRRLFISLIVISTSQSFAMIIDELYRLNKENKDSENFMLFFSTNLFFVVLGVQYNLRAAKCAQLEFDVNRLSPQGLAKQVQIVLAMLEMSNWDAQVDTYFKGILHRHMEFQCQHPVLNGEARCFCRKKRIFDPKKKKEFPTSEWIMYKAVFIKFLIKSWLETYLGQNDSFTVQILYARFMFVKMRNHSVALHILNDLEKRFTFIIDRYRAYQLKYQIKRYVKHLNKDSYKGKLEIEKALFVEEQIDTIKMNIIEILKQNSQFWQLLQQTTINLEEVDGLLKEQFKKINHTNQLWITITNYLDYKKKWKFYYAWFKLYILNKKIKNRILDNFQGLQVNENDIFSEELQENNAEEDIGSIKSGQVDQEKIEVKSKKIVFDKKACILQCNDDPNALIINVNKQFTRIFGYKREDVVEKATISHLMPDIFSAVHPSIIQDYKINGKTSTLYSQKKVYCIHKSGVLFTAWKFVKLYVDMNGQSQFVVMIRPTDLNNEKKHDFIVINSDWEINGMTANLHQILHVDSSIFQKKNSQNLLVNLLLFAPKLIQYSRVRNLVDEAKDLKIFGMVKNEKPTHRGIEPQSSTNSNQPQKEKDQPIIKVSEMVNSNSLQVGQSRPSVAYSDMEIPSRVFIPQQSLDVPDKTFVAQQSSGSDKNEFDIQQHLNQMNEIQQGMAQEIQRQAQKVIQKQRQEQFQVNYQRIQTEKAENRSDSDDNLSKDEMMNIGAEKRKYKTVQSVLDGKIENGEQISFRMKIPENLLQACMHYSSQKYKMYQIKRAEDEQVKNQEFQDKNKQKRDKNYVKQGTAQRELKKKFRQKFQLAAENQKKQEDKTFYELLLEIYEKFLQDSRKKQFKISCTISFYRIRDERVGIIKVQGITEVQKVKRRENNRKLSYLPRNMISRGKGSLMQDFQRQPSKIDGQQQMHQKFASITSDGESRLVSPVVREGASKTKQTSKSNGLGYQLQKEEPQLDDGNDKDLLIDSKTFNKIINWDTFQQQFKMQQGSKSFSLNVIDNIFRKEDNNKPRKFLVKISYLTWFLRLMFLAIITLNLLTYFLKPFQEYNPIKNQAQRIFDLSQMQTYVIEAYDTLLDLLIYQDADFTQFSIRGQPISSKIEFYTYQASQIDSGYNFIKDQINDINQQETFLDSSIFYNPPIMDETITGSVNVSLTLDHKDFFTKFIMIEHEIAQMDPLQLQMLSAANPGVRFIRFITIPYLYNQMNNAVLALQDNLSNRSSSMSQFIVIILILEGGIFIFGFVGLLLIIIWICQTYKAILKMFILIKKYDLNKIVKQQKFIESQFKYITNKDDEIAGIIHRTEYSRMNSNASKHQFQQQQNFLLINEGEEQNINKKKDKKVEDKKLLRSLTFKLSFTYIVLVCLAASASITFFLNLKNSSDHIGLLIKAGKTTIQDFSDSQLLLIAVKERYFNESNYQETFLVKAGEMMRSLIVDVKVTPSIDDSQYGKFYDSFQKMYFGNLCQILLERGLISTEVYEDCASLLLGKLEDGVVAFNQYYASNTEDYILNKESRFGFIDADQIWAFNQAIDYIKGAYRGLLDYWSEDLVSLIDSDATIVLALLIVMLIFQLIVFFTIAELYLVNQLNSTFMFYRQVYKSYMPNDIIQKEKIIRAQLIKYSLIKR